MGNAKRVAMDGGIKIIQLDAKSASVLDDVAAGVFDAPVRPDYLAAFLAEANHHMLLAIAGDLVVGMASAVVYVHPDKPRNLWINEVGVGDDWRRQGIARGLMAAVLDLSEALGCEEAWLGTELTNLPALALYRGIEGAEEEAGVYFTWDTEPD